MYRSAIFTAIAASIITAGMSISPANADGLVSFDVGDSHVCIGGWSCLFQPKKHPGRDSNNSADHRGNTTDHRDIKERKNTVVLVKPKVRDHRTKIIVRDHRN